MGVALGKGKAHTGSLPVYIPSLITAMVPALLVGALHKDVDEELLTNTN